MKTNKYKQWLCLLGLAGMNCVTWGATNVVEMISPTQSNLEQTTTKTNDNPWDFRLGILGWCAGAEGNVGVGGRSVHIDESFADIADVLDFTIALNLEVRKNRWLLFVDGLYLKTSTEDQPRGLLAGVVSEAQLTQKQFIGDFDLGYTCIDKEKFSLDLYVGTRINHDEADLAAQFFAGPRPTFSASKTWADPVIGFQVTGQVCPRFALFARADVGGFGLVSHITYQVNGGGDLKISQHTYLRLTYRYLGTDYTSGGFTYDVRNGGPQLEFGWHW